MNDEEATRIMNRIWHNSTSYSVSYACLSGEHNKCRMICECQCHQRKESD